MVSTDDERGESPSDRGVLYHSRRRILEAAAAAGVLSSLGLATSVQENRIELGGDTPGWKGRAPSSIEGETNPTLDLEEGTTYVLEWENVDGQPHNFVIEDADGNNIVRTKVISERGETQSVEFQATRAMSEYYCEVHPQSMRGTVSIGGQTQNGGGTPDEAPPFFEKGTKVGVTHVAENMTGPTDFAAVAGTDLMLVADQTGELWAVDADGRQEEPMINLSDRMVAVGEEFAGSYADPESNYDERGLLGVEPHPNVQENGRLFLHYSAPPNDETPDGWSHVEVVSEFTMNVEQRSVDPDSETVLMTFQKPQYNHDAGPIAFGPDGYLYVPMGDGGGANDNMYGHVDDWYDGNDGGNGQDVTQNLLGGIHRIDVDRGSGDAREMVDVSMPEADADQVEALLDRVEAALDDVTTRDLARFVESVGLDPGQFDLDTLLDRLRTAVESGKPTAVDVGGKPYGIPEDNPLVGTEGRDEYYAWGFRNPFGITFDSSGRMIVADAGQNLWEEANVVEKGGNYGWNVKEGTHCFSTDDPGMPPQNCPNSTPDSVRGGEELIDPVVEYPHNFQGGPVGIVIAGGHVYEAGDVPNLQGKYVFGDWTKDVARQEPAGRLLAAAPAGDGGGDGGNDGGGNDGDSTGGGGGEGNGDGGGGGAVPRGDLWNMEELVIEGSEDGTLNRFVRQFGQGPDGDVYVLVNQMGVPKGDTGAVLKLVPPGEGEQLGSR